MDFVVFNLFFMFVADNGKTLNTFIEIQHRELAGSNRMVRFRPLYLLSSSFRFIIG